jgi:hypothetical protein
LVTVRVPARYRRYAKQTGALQVFSEPIACATYPIGRILPEQSLSKVTKGYKEQASDTLSSVADFPHA